ncbi:hypothetical protein [Plantactinospora sp. B5E13]|uniref:hypothetical protein n=1 Tax=unclassified Plantactinospora TaxID=2631981 RepID=UPI00325DABF5
MAAKRKTRSGRKSATVTKPTGRELAGDQLAGGKSAGPTSAGAGDAAVAESSEAARPVLPAASRPAAPTTGPVPRGGAGFSGMGRGQGAGSARRYAFRRS